MREEFRSPAKVNLGLRILGLRPDGYHEVDTVLQMVDLWDTLRVRPGGRRLIVRCDHPDVPPGSANLAYRAADLLRREAGVREGAEVSIEKSIPVGAGLGGGSGNAAMALWALNRLWGLGLGREELIALARRLGSDVPFFLTSARARGRGRGDELEPLEAGKPLPLLLVKPPISLRTEEVYARSRGRLTKSGSPPTIPSHPHRLSGVMYRNDLEPVVQEFSPWVGRLKGELRKAGARRALMSGSGPTVFGVFASLAAAERAAEGFRRGGHWVRVTRSLPSLDRFLGQPVGR